MTRHGEVIAGDADYPRNQWYVAAYAHELENGPVSRWLLDTPVVLFRGESGPAVALFDRCPHRGLRLSAGQVVGDNIQCTYHGMQFDGAGRCAVLPSGGPVSERMCVDSYPVVEDWAWLWIWMGDPALADPAEVPRVAEFGFGREGWHDEPAGLLPVGANYLLPFENLLDASHISFLHHGLIDGGDVASMPFDIEQEDNWMRVIRRIPNEPLSPLTRKTFAITGDTADRTITADAHAPNLCGIRVDLQPHEGDTSLKVNQLLVGITPATRTRCYQFTAVAQNFPFLNTDREEDVKNLLMEDVDAMEDIQQLMDQLGPSRCVEVSVNADTAAMRMRKRIIAMLERESGGQGAA